MIQYQPRDDPLDEKTYLKDTIIVGGLVFLAFYIHDLIDYDNPRLDKTITELQSGDPTAIAQALLDISSLDMASA
ncbi:MAG: hypothetical protein CSA50_08040 [Gammaproteobacteria bacterium]|nr:MAG: hypothetical protein CSA50_08040 [Gammaproteobacteria bacterium]